MKKFHLKQGDEVHIFNDGHCWTTKVEGFYSYGMKVEDGLIPFYARSFYSCGYANQDRFFTVKKKWHYYPAKLLDDIRQIWYLFTG